MDVTIIGAGLCGLSCAIHLAKLGFLVTIYEKKSLSEIIKSKTMKNHSRDLSMDISERGIFALKEMNIFEEIKKQSVAMRYKIFHDEKSNLEYVPFGVNENQVVYAVCREYLFKCLYERACSFKNITINFNANLLNIDGQNNTIEIKQEAVVKKNQFNFLIGTDGIHSKVRSFLEGQGLQFSFFSMTKGYKEIFIPKIDKSKFEFHANHFWSRDGYMLVAQPNFDSTFTAALIMDKKGQGISFESVISDNVERFFCEKFPDVFPLIPNLRAQYENNVVGGLQIIETSKITYENKIMIIGDSAHAMTPFLGQGVNCCFEDCSVFSECLLQTNNNLTLAATIFENRRLKNISSIVKLSYENYPELFGNVDIKKEILLRKIDVELMKNFPIYRSFHNLICFDRADYWTIDKLKALQYSMLNKIADGVNDINEVDLTKAKRELEKYQETISNKDFLI